MHMWFHSIYVSGFRVQEGGLLILLTEHRQITKHGLIELVLFFTGTSKGTSQVPIVADVGVTIHLDNVMKPHLNFIDYLNSKLVGPDDSFQFIVLVQAGQGSLTYNNEVSFYIHEVARLIHHLYMRGVHMKHVCQGFSPLHLDTGSWDNDQGA